MPTQAFIYDVLRSPRGRADGTDDLYEVKPIDLLSQCLRAFQRRSGREDLPAGIDDLIIGCNTPAGDQGYNIARAALLNAGWAQARGGLQINRFNTSGLEAINLAAARITAGYGKVMIAGGLECMSRVPTYLNSGPMMNDPSTVINSHYIPQGVAADLVASTHRISRADLDAYALASHAKAIAAAQAGHFAASLETITDANGLVILAEDRIPRQDLTTEFLGELPPRFAEMGLAGFNEMALHRFPLVDHIAHLHTTGNTSKAADGCALCLLGDLESGRNLGLEPRAKIRAVALSAVDATLLSGGVNACDLALEQAGLQRQDIDLWEFNESFAAPTIRFQQQLGIPDDRFNVLGGAIALGEPLGAVGGMMLCHLLDELERRDLTLGSLTIDAGAGLAVSTVVERIA
ncbi:acetyl-CoA C-acyltransferase [Neolewinella lacunae]|uniref:Acetyl-CoA C-acyltransferase n=1 Tax=Neolewinella lacunae TaxID=1517758 RepID=A0A923T8Y2_9BACT|nr:acetyl-CoA C-acyltransferase [Neolewinella lacunae]MBC6994468.1 acetyl-CoA C-acyltransferase [Neolewinella lacunae]MDN3634161.1 acetyl-CoA C-acyltransferase [Neolewinella lacunae]